ncbi:MAG: GNAT family N-acetyltransferase, partial [Parabacteroides sp.]
MEDETLTSNELWLAKAKGPDSNRIWEIILQAKVQMKRLGSHQWDDNYPTGELIQEDIQTERGYVLRDNESIVAYGVISFEAEPAYAQIRGKWQNEQPYVIVHRLAVAEEVKHQGIA